ncbi:proliferating cell nuclear antigen (pcna) [Candidatus Woesearchaeota archaeon]|jgi:proliferating cell nuclear antigen|nr:proliferating cell nuclear antigen (pcna) [Candidatus Woesearchaeota archaeon]MBT3438836.1 proliferating cell nuclear antigen (pcna) [Candidatus Woesearchaeota archaeon]MBT4057940.1 proliferating cell nuclear antigen (pcna) [Candidatus Woesearchaeota archaeon]MBT4208668.1 proliferating cell nuclear antigen (pcna) [Candidatus Woesearchaeota archaeon]MBT4783380.1 proliferating cell nuclear antigen (pcna) [Candidatus Woesearchaeota archaeon]
MKLTLAEPRTLVDSINVISEIVNEVRFDVDGEKIGLVAMDPANVAMIDFKLFSSAFSEYSVDKSHQLCISLDSLKAVLKRVKPSDMLTLELDEEKNKLKIQLKGDNVRTFNLALIDVDEKEQRVPDLNFSATIETSSSIFDGAIQDADVIADAVVLKALENSFVVEGENNMSQVTTEIPKDDDTIITLNSVEEFKSKYSIEYLKKIIKGGKLTGKVKLQFGNDYPLRVDYLVQDKLNLGFILAPRVAND